MAQMAIPALVASTALQATGSIMAGREQARAAAFERQQLGVQEQMQRTAAAQAEARRREEFTQGLQTIQALRAGRGVGAGSPTGMAIMDSLRRESDRDIRTERLNFLSGAEQSRLAAGEAGRRGRAAMLQGFLGAAGAIAGGAFRGSLLTPSASDGYGATGRGWTIRGRNGMMGGGV